MNDSLFADKVPEYRVLEHIKRSKTQGITVLTNCPLQVPAPGLGIVHESIIILQKTYLKRRKDVNNEHGYGDYNNQGSRIVVISAVFFFFRSRLEHRL